MNKSNMIIAGSGRDKKKKKKSFFDERLLAVARDELFCPRMLKVQHDSVHLLDSPCRLNLECLALLFTEYHS